MPRGWSIEHCSLIVLRTAEWKYVQFSADPAVLPPLLFDLTNDPQQIVNLAEDPASAPAMLDCAQRLVRHRMRHEDRTLSTNHLSFDRGLIHRADPRR